MNSLFRWLASASAALLLAGCAEPLVFSEVFQLPEDGKIYTKYNIWYTDAENISCLNIQQGAFIPVGTEIEPVEVSPFGNKITFRVPSMNKNFVLHFSEGYRLCTLRSYVLDTFTTDNAEKLFAANAVSPKMKAHILRGEVVVGMNEREVLLACGPPPACRTPDRRQETWMYWKTPASTLRLIFRNDQVRSILADTEQ